MSKIILTGPECSGKSTLSQALAQHYKVAYASEYAREFLSKLNRPYQERDLVSIAIGQHRLINALRKSPITIADTGIEVIKIWSEVKYQRSSPIIKHLLNINKPDLFILCGVDIPYQEDPLREHPNDRKELYQIYLKELKSLNVPYIEVSGSTEDRLKKSIKKIQSISA